MCIRDSPPREAGEGKPLARSPASGKPPSRCAAVREKRFAVSLAFSHALRAYKGKVVGLWSHLPVRSAQGVCPVSYTHLHKEFKKCSTAFLGGGSHLIPSGKLPRDVVEYLQKANDSKGAFSMGAYISTFPTGFAGLIPAALQKLLPGAQVVLLSARKREAEAAAQEMGFPLRQRYDTLVNGKKAAVYLLEVGPAL